MIFLVALISFLAVSHAQTQTTACDCWTKECGYCADVSCAVKYDLGRSTDGISVTSQLTWRQINHVLFFDGNGNALGRFGFSLSRLHLTGCIACQAPEAMQQLNKSLPKGQTSWTVRFDEGAIKLAIGGETFFEQTLIGECSEHYKDIQYFSFFESSCANKFTLTSGMQAGENLNETCGGTCPE